MREGDDGAHPERPLPPTFPPRRRLAVAPARLGLIATPVLAVGIALGSSLGLVTSLYLAFLVVGLPGLALSQARLIHGLEIDRVPAYLSSIAAIALLGSVAAVVGVLAFDHRRLGLVGLPLGTTLLWTAALLGTAALLVFVFWATGRLVGVPESPVLRRLLPRTVAEKAVFLVLSGAAGLGEEVAFRGFVLAALTELTGSPWTALLLSSGPFGVVHVYQGTIGVVRTALLGFALGVPVVITGSLWPSVVAHTLVDIVGGLVLGDALVGPARQADEPT